MRPEPTRRRPSSSATRRSMTMRAAPLSSTKASGREPSTLTRTNTSPPTSSKGRTVTLSSRANTTSGASPARAGGTPHAAAAHGAIRTTSAPAPIRTAGAYLPPCIGRGSYRTLSAEEDVHPQGGSGRHALTGSGDPETGGSHYGSRRGGRTPQPHQAETGPPGLPRAPLDGHARGLHGGGHGEPAGGAQRLPAALRHDPVARRHGVHPPARALRALPPVRRSRGQRARRRLRPRRTPYAARPQHQVRGLWLRHREAHLAVARTGGLFEVHHRAASQERHRAVFRTA